jgi:hypothetical protein
VGQLDVFDLIPLKVVLLSSKDLSKEAELALVELRQINLACNIL